MICNQYEKSKAYEILENLKSLDLSKLDSNSHRLRRNIESLLNNFVITGRYIPVNDGRFHRSILYPEKPRNLSFLKYPPRVKTGLGRANLPKNPVFYCSGDPRSTLFEMKIKSGDTFVLSKWTCTREIPVLPMGYTSTCFEKLKSNRNCPLVIPADSRSPLENDLLNIEIKNFLDRKFTDPDKNEYLLTAMVSDYFLSRYNYGDCGIAYPAVAMRANADNFVFPPNVMDRSLSFHSAAWYRVDKVDYDKFEFIVSKLEIAKKIDKNGSLFWKNVSKEEVYYL